MTTKVINDFKYQFEIKKDYFECHEILEEAWKENFPNFSKENEYVVLLQYAVCLYHLRNQNYRGSQKLIDSLFKNYNSSVESSLSQVIDTDNFNKQLNKLDTLILNKHYEHLPLKWKK